MDSHACRGVSASSSQPALHQSSVQAHRERTQLGHHLVGTGLRSLVASAGQRADDLLDQAHFAVGSGLERSDVPRLEAELGQLRRSLAHRERIGVEELRTRLRAHDAERDELVQLLLRQPRAGHQLARPTSADR